MGRAMNVRLLSTVAVVVALSGCFGAGSKAFRKGESAQKAGQLEEAHQHYKAALEAEPNNAKYQRALDEVGRELARAHRATAQAKEKSGDWAAAAAAWERALAFEPKNQEYAVRRDLSALKAKNLGPDEWYQGVSRIAESYPNDDIASRTLAGARAAAYQYNINLAEQFLATGEGARAFDYFERAKGIDPTTPGLKADSYARAEAMKMAEEAEAKLAENDAVGAYELFQQAYARMPLPAIKRKMARAKSKASAILSRLESARAKVERGRHRDALRIYGAILDMEGAPPFIEEEAAKVRRELIAKKAAEAKAQAERGRIRQGYRTLMDALTYANLGRVERDTFKSAMDHAKAGRPGKALDVLDKVGISPSGDLYGAGRSLAVAAAIKQLSRAKRIAKRDAQRALQMVTDLKPFEEDVPDIAALRRQLRVGSFQELLDEALAEAKRGDDAEAASLLLAALNASAAPERMRAPSAQGCDELKSGRYAAAEQSFTEALAAAPRSRLAQRGIDIARLRRKVGEKEAAATITFGRGNLEKAVATLEAALEVQPKNENAAKAAVALLRRAERGGPDAKVAELLGYAARLSVLTSADQRAVEEGVAKLAAGDHAAAQDAFAEADSREIGKVGKRIARKRMLAALSSGAKGAAQGDEGSAHALAELLKKDPNNAEARRAVKAMLDQAKRHASKKEDAEAARFLGLATIATAPAPGVKVHLDAGNQALAEGDMASAERSYAEALELEPEGRVVQVAFQIAKNARVGMLSSAMADAKKTGNVDRVAAELRKTLELDPKSEAARKAFAELLAEAKRQAEQGNDAQAAALLDAANVVSRPISAQKKIGSAIALIGKGEHEKAAEAFDAILKKAESKVASAGRDITRIRTKAVLLADAKKLESGEDNTRGAMAAKKLFEMDAADRTAKAAVEAALARASKAAAGGDDRIAARELKAAAIALGEEKEAKKAIQKLETGRYQDAEDLFGYSSSSLVAKKGQEIARGRRLGNLKEGLSGEGEEAARSIRALLAANPNDREARRAFEKLLTEAKQAGRKGDDQTAGQKLKLASIAAGAPGDLSSAVETAAGHLSEGRYAEAEKAFGEAAAEAKDSKVAKTGLEVARARRRAAEREASRAIARADDPRPHAEVLKASLLVEPSSRTVARALGSLIQGAKRSARKGEDAKTAQMLEAAAMLENPSPETQVKLTEASGLYAKGSFEEAEEAFASANGDDGSKVASLGKTLARSRRIALLEDEWTAARKEKDVLRESAVVQKILALDPRHAKAKAAARRLEKRVGSSRVDAAISNKEMGKLGVAYVYLERALELNENDAKAKAEMQDVRKQLEDRLDLILLVEPVERAKGLGGSACLALDEMLREEVMTDASKRTDLGGYVLSPGWTKAVEEKSEKAPDVSGSIAIQLTKCKTTPRDGKVKFEWSVLVPRGGSPTAKGEVTTELPDGIIPKEEQDEAGNNAKRALAKRGTEAFLRSFENERGGIELWLLTLAEHAVKKNDVAMAADAYARLSIKAPPSIDPERLAKVEAFLERELR